MIQSLHVVLQFIFDSDDKEIDFRAVSDLLGSVDKRASHQALSKIQAGIYDGDQLSTRPDVGRGMGVL